MTKVLPERVDEIGKLGVVKDEKLNKILGNK